MNDTDLAFASIEEVGKLFRKRKLSPVELTKLMLARIEQLNPKLNAYITVTAELALEQSKKAESELFGRRAQKGHRDRGPLHGIPISLKDNICTKDIRTTAGSKILKDFIPPCDAQIVARLREAGAVILGKTNLHEFAYGVTSSNPHYGAVRNPWDPRRIPGGSSGGSAAAVAAGLGYGSMGTDTGGSIRIPASLSGVTGLKPSWGRISCAGIIPLSPALDCAGPLARTVGDVATLAGVLYSRVGRQPNLLSSAARRSGKFRLGIPRQLFFDALSPEVRKAFDTEDAGNHIAWAEAALYHQQQGYFPARAAEYGDDVGSRLEMGSKVPAVDYLRALEIQRQFFEQLHWALAEADVDAMVFPSTAIEAPLLNQETIRIGTHEYATRALLLRNNRPANLAGVPAVSVPCGFTGSGLPIGFELMAGVASEPVLLRIANIFERSRSENLRPPLAV